MQFAPVIAPEIFARHPDFHLASIVVRNATIRAPDAQAREDVIAAAEASVGQDEAGRDAHLAAWADAYKGFGAKPNRTPCSVAALIKRVRKDHSLPRISSLVDAYNAVSVLYGVPVGGEDLDLYRGLPRLMIASGDEAFETVQQGEPVIEHPDPGEVVWCDDLGVTCRRWNWRQGRRTMVTPGSTALWLVLEALEPMSADRLKAAAEHLSDVILALCPDARVETAYFDASTPPTPMQ
jgi:DNA/RNA-binding domain of Phe-tRNA-synthetase-like protein